MTDTTCTCPVHGKEAVAGLHALVVLDRSGSMQMIKEDTIGGFNTYIAGLANSSPDSKLTLILFDSQGIDTVYKAKPIAMAPQLTSETYVPRSATPLYDAIGRAATILGEDKAEHKALVILTDGLENASREWRKDAIKKMLDERQEKDGWLVIYLGANQDAFSEGANIGTVSANTMNYDTGNMRETFFAAASATHRYAASASPAEGRLQASFTAEERRKAIDPKKKR